ncbi:GH25 family lysozyme [Dactylosporangium sp. NPDC051541]|uniref:GH25 family lysozyme n=1 Tax=Dactylosporangium sp. NPDC051541 TaxID=3363977 RepID=UPI00379CC347
MRKLAMVAALAACLAAAVPTGDALAAPADFSVRGIDISHHQGVIDWGAVAGNSQQFAYMKATEGVDYTDETFTTNYAGARGNGLYAGAYHFALPDKSGGAAQADYFLDRANFRHDGRTLPPMVDIEWPDGPSGSPSPCYGMTPSALVNWLHDFIDRVRERTGGPTVIYTNTTWWNPCTGSNTSFGSSPLSIADYNSNTAANPTPLPAGWSTWTFWQHTDAGTVAGVKTGVDKDVFNGSAVALAAFAGGRRPVNDFDADGKSDIALFRPSAGQWNIKSAARGVQLYGSYPYGGGDDVALTGDFDNDGYTDIALFRKTTGQWNIKSVKRGVQLYASYPYGGGDDTPLTGDFDGDGYTDIALFRRTTGQWNILSLHRGVQIVASYPYGGGNDTPLAGDFDGDGYDDLALFRKTTGQWNILSLHRGVQIVASYPYGGGDDIPMAGDFDNDGKDDIALFRTTTGQWNVKSVARGVQLFASYQYGGGDDIALTGDYDGDGYADFGLFRVTTGQWNILSPHRGVQLLASHQYGGGNDLPATVIPTG